MANVHYRGAPVNSRQPPPPSSGGGEPYTTNNNVNNNNNSLGPASSFSEFYYNEFGSLRSSSSISDTASEVDTELLKMMRDANVVRLKRNAATKVRREQRRPRLNSGSRSIAPTMSEKDFNALVRFSKLKIGHAVQQQKSPSLCRESRYRHSGDTIVKQSLSSWSSLRDTPSLSWCDSDTLAVKSTTSGGTLYKPNKSLYRQAASNNNNSNNNYTTVGSNSGVSSSYISQDETYTTIKNESSKTKPVTFTSLLDTSAELVLSMVCYNQCYSDSTA